jgi:hypothetical protein
MPQVTCVLKFQQQLWLCGVDLAVVDKLKPELLQVGAVFCPCSVYAKQQYK